MFFVISPTKLGRCWCNLVHCFLNKFAAKWCKQFLHYHITWIMSLHYLAHVLPLSRYRKEFHNSSHLNCGLQFRQIWIQFIIAYGKYCKRRYTKHASLIWYPLSSSPLTNGCRNDDIIQLGPLRSQSLFQFVQISDTHSCSYFPKWLATILIPKSDYFPALAYSK